MVKKLIKASALILVALVIATDSYAQEPQVPQVPSEMLPAPARPAHKLEDFSRLAQAIGERIVLIDPQGVVREGVLAEMTSDAITMRFASGMQSIARAEIASAERFKDPTSDGVAKGMLFAAICGIGDVTMGQYLGGIAAFGVIGYLIDAGEGHRQPLYRAPGFSSHTASLPSARSVVFRIKF